MSQPLWPQVDDLITARGSEATEPSLGAGGGPAPEAPCRTPGAAVRCGLDSCGRQRVAHDLARARSARAVPASFGVIESGAVSLGQLEGQQMPRFLMFFLFSALKGQP